MVLAAMSASAYDVLEAGTAASPNYYIIQANRGTNRFLGYDASAANTQLVRTSTITSSNVWEVTEGTASGSYVFKNHDADVYMFTFGTDTPGNSAQANVSSTPVDVFPKSMNNGAYALSLNNANGYFHQDSKQNNTALDAPGGASTTLGNYIPVEGEGTTYWLTKFNVAEGQTFDEAFAEAALTAEARLSTESAIATLNGYAAYTSIPAGLISTINSTIDDLRNIKGSEDYQTVIENMKNGVVSEYVSGQTFALKSLFRAGSEYSDGHDFIGVNSNGNSYQWSNDAQDYKSWFTFVPADGGGFVLYNVYTKTYVAQAGYGAQIAPTTDLASAQVIKPQFNSNGDYSGIGFGAGSYALHAQQPSQNNKSGGKLSYYIMNDPGAVWTVEPINTDNVVSDYLTNVISAFTDNVPASVVPILDNFISANTDTKYIDFDFLGYQAPANAELETVFNGKIWTLRNLRRVADASIDNYYLAVNTEGDDYESVTSSADFNALYKFTSVAGGGYTLYNSNTKTYIGFVNSQFTPVDEESSAQTFYPVICQGGNFCGISLPMNANKTGNGINVDTKATGKAVPWGYTDSGSIWAIHLFDEDEAVEEITGNIETDLASYAANIPEVKSIMDAAIAQLDDLTYSPTLASEAAAIEAKAIEDANAYMNEYLNGKSFSLKGLRNNKFECFTENGFTVVATDDNVDTYFGFKKAEDGGYILSNWNSTKYVGPAQSGSMTIVTDAENAVKVYPTLYKVAGLYGIAFPFENSTANGTEGLNINTGLHSWDISNGPGSVFTLVNHGETVGVVEIQAVEGVTIYDLSGRRLAAPVKGINIINGKKVLVK